MAWFNKDDQKGQEDYRELTVKTGDIKELVDNSIAIRENEEAQIVAWKQTLDKQLAEDAEASELEQLEKDKAAVQEQITAHITLRKEQGKEMQELVEMTAYSCY